MRQEFNKFIQSMVCRTETLAKFVFVFRIGGTAQPRQLLIYYHNMDRLEGFKKNSSRKNILSEGNIGKVTLQLRALFPWQQNWSAR